MKRTRILAVALAGVLLLPAFAVAEEKEWQNTLALYLWGIMADGDAEVGEQSVPVDLDLSDALEDLEMAGMARYRGQAEKWAIVADIVYAGLGDSSEKDSVRTGADVDLLIAQLDAAWRFHEHAELLMGVRYAELDSEVTVEGPVQTIEAENEASLVDGVIGLRGLAEMSEKWRFQAQGDVGAGDSDLTWQAMMNFGYLPNDNVSVWFGYRAIGYDFDDSGERNRFGMDVTFHGPQLGVGFHW